MKYSIFLDDVNGLEDFNPEIFNLVVYMDEDYRITGYTDLRDREVEGSGENLKMVSHNDVEEIRKKLIKWGFDINS